MRTSQRFLLRRVVRAPGVGGAAGLTAGLAAGLVAGVLLAAFSGPGPLAPQGLAAQGPPGVQRIIEPPPSAPSTGWLGLRLRAVYEGGAGARGTVGARAIVSPPGHVEVTEVIRGGPAEGAGVRPGDRLLRIRGEEALRLLEAGSLGSFAPGERVPLEVEREGRRLSLQVVAAVRPAHEAAIRAVEVARLRSDSIVAVVVRELERVREVVERPALTMRFEGTPPGEGEAGGRIVLLRPSFQIDSLARLRGDLGPAAVPPPGPRAIPRFPFLRGEGEGVPRPPGPPAPGGSVAPGRIPIPGAEGESPALALRFYGDRTLLGAQVTPLNPGLARYFGVGEGILVTDVVDGAPAARAGIRAGDVIIALRWRTGRADGITELAALRGAVSEGWRTPPLHVQIVREGRTLEVEIPTGR